MSSRRMGIEGVCRSKKNEASREPSISLKVANHNQTAENESCFDWSFMHKAWVGVNVEWKCSSQNYATAHGNFF